MGKGDSRRGKHKNRQTWEAAVALAPVPRREKDGQTTRKSRKHKPPEDDPRKLGLGVRAKQMGKDASEWRSFASPAYGEAAGRALVIFYGETSGEDLFALYRALTASERRFHSLCLGLSAYPKAARLEIAPERFETRADDRPDLRSDEERERDARKDWSGWEDHLNKLGLVDYSAIASARFGWGEMMRDGRVTNTGILFCRAMAKLQEVMG